MPEEYAINRTVWFYYYKKKHARLMHCTRKYISSITTNSSDTYDCYFVSIFDYRGNYYDVELMLEFHEYPYDEKQYVNDVCKDIVDYVEEESSIGTARKVTGEPHVRSSGYENEYELKFAFDITRADLNRFGINVSETAKELGLI